VRGVRAIDDQAAVVLPKRHIARLIS
jgi:hypothetical protein